MFLIGAGSLIDAIDRRFGGKGALSRIGVAVSGGSDSLALLHLLHDWGRAEHLAAATVDHGLRPEAAEEAATVARVCDGLGIPHTTLKWRGWDGKGNLQGLARDSRYSLLAEWAQAEKLDTVCLGHTLDDQVETFLMRLSRAAGIDGLSGMDHRIERDGARFDRPLLGARRASLRAYLDARGVAWLDDPSNEDARFDRVKVRRALAALEDAGIEAESIENSISNLRLAGLALRIQAREIASKIVRETAGDLIFDRARLRRLDPEMSHRLLTGALMFVSSEHYPPRADGVVEVDAAIRAGRNATLHGCLVLVSDMTVRITRELKAVASTEAATDEPWDTRWVLSGPHDETLTIRALGDDVATCPDWRTTGLPRQSLMSSPAIWRGGHLVAAPVAGLSNGWSAAATGRGSFADFLVSR